MKKFIPYIFITAFVGTFLMVSFSSSIFKPKQADAQYIQAVILIGSQIWKNKNLLATLAVGGAIIWGNEKLADMTFGKMLAWTSDFTWYVSSKLFNISSRFLDYAVDFSVKDFKQNIENIGVVNQGYKIILNVANMIFIFILLYIAINMILGIGSGDIKKLLTNIIVVALLMNFSLFMTKVIIDASNIVAMGFYNAVRTEVTSAESDGNQQIISVGSISTAMMSGLRLQTQMSAPSSEYNKEDSVHGFTNFNIAMNQFGGSALLLVSAFVFFSAAFLFVIRIITLLFYMIFSPVAFLGYVFPQLEKYSKNWWTGLQNQAFFAPVFLFIVYLISSIVNSGQLWAAVGGSSDPSATFYDFISSSGQLGFPIIMNYVILISLMSGGLIAAKSMASVGSSGIVGYADKFRGWAQGVAGRNTLGRAAYIMGDSDVMKRIVSKSPTIGGFAKKQFDSVAGVSFGGARGGYGKALKDSVEQKRKTADWLKYKGKDTETMEKNIEEEKKAQKKRDDAMPGLRENVAAAKQAYDESEKEREKWQKEYNIYKDAKSEEELKQAKEKAELAKQEFEREQNRLTDEQTKTKESADRVETYEKDLKETQNKWKTAYRENLKFDSNVLNKIFPSGAKAAEEIRKGKKSAKKLMEEIMEESGEIPKKEEGKKEGKKEDKGA